MKKWWLPLVFVVVLAALGVWGWRAVFPGPAQVIRQRLTELARTASFSAGEGTLPRLAHAQALASLCTPDVTIAVDIPGHARQTFSGRDEVLQAAVAARSGGSSLKVEFFDILVTLSADRNSAVANLTAKAKVPRENDFYVQELTFGLKKVEGKWLIFRAETVRDLSPYAVTRYAGMLQNYRPTLNLKSTWRLKVSTFATTTSTWSPSLNTRRVRRPTSWLRCASNW